MISKLHDVRIEMSTSFIIACIYRSTQFAPGKRLSVVALFHAWNTSCCLRYLWLFFCSVFTTIAPYQIHFFPNCLRSERDFANVIYASRQSRFGQKYVYVKEMRIISLGHFHSMFSTQFTLQLMLKIVYFQMVSLNEFLKCLFLPFVGLHDLFFEDKRLDALNSTVEYIDTQ